MSLVIISNGLLTLVGTLFSSFQVESVCVGESFRLISLTYKYQKQTETLTLKTT